MSYATLTIYIHYTDSQYKILCFFSHSIALVPLPPPEFKKKVLSELKKVLGLVFEAEQGSRNILRHGLKITYFLPRVEGKSIWVLVNYMIIHYYIVISHKTKKIYS